MKTKLTTLVLVLFALIFPTLHAQQLSDSPPSNAVLEVLELEADFKSTLDLLEARLRTTYRRVNAGTAEQIQARLDAMGTQAVLNFARYQAIYDFVKSVRPASSVLAPDPERFVQNQDGTVTYVPEEE